MVHMCVLYVIRQLYHSDSFLVFFTSSQHHISRSKQADGSFPRSVRRPFYRDEHEGVDVETAVAPHPPVRLRALPVLLLHFLHFLHRHS